MKFEFESVLVNLEENILIVFFCISGCIRRSSKQTTDTDLTLQFFSLIKLTSAFIFVFCGLLFAFCFYVSIFCLTLLLCVVENTQLFNDLSG